MAQKKLTAKQKKEQAEKQRKMEMLVLSIVAVALIAILVVGVVLSGAKNSFTTTNTNTNHGATNPPTTTAPVHEHTDNCNHGDGATLETAQATHIVTIQIADYGTIKAELYGNTAPATVANFVSLIESGFYDGLTFHRIKKDFVMQGGDPQGNGYGGSDQNVVGEFAANGFENNLSHKRGVLSMARSNAYDSASSQFFIMHADYTGLDGAYAAFGMVIEGMDVVDAICESAKPSDGNGSIPADAQPVITSITVETVN